VGAMGGQEGRDRTTVRGTTSFAPIAFHAASPLSLSLSLSPSLPPALPRSLPLILLFLSSALLSSYPLAAAPSRSHGDASARVTPSPSPSPSPSAPFMPPLLSASTIVFCFIITAARLRSRRSLARLRSTISFCDAGGTRLLLFLLLSCRGEGG